MFIQHTIVLKDADQVLLNSAIFKYRLVWKFMILFFFTEEAVIDWTPLKSDLKYELKHTKMARVKITINKAYPKPTYKL